MNFILRACLVGLLFSTFAGSSGAEAASTRQIVTTYSKAAIDSGQAVGVGVAVIYGSAAPQLFTFGNSVVGAGATPSRAFQTNDLFEIGSVTKVFTTNLLGQAVHRGRVALDDPLSNYATQLGTLKPMTGQVTLEELADFTGGIADYAPLCSKQSVPGCLPSSRPNIRQYTAADFAAFFRQTVPEDYSQQPPKPATTLPTSYYYSDYAVGLLGLLLASGDAPLANADLNRWFRMTQREILAPLNMTDTYLNVPATLAPRLAGGYQQATARAHVSGGQVNSLTLTSGGALYRRAPRVRIIGGGGTGATAAATLSGDAVSAISVTDPGTGYLAPAAVTFTNGGSSQTAQAQVIVRNGEVAAIAVLSGGSGYVRAPTITISGGRAASGRDATATAQIANGQVVRFTITDPGQGYVPPLSVIVEPGRATENAVPIWAPAGALTTTLADLATFAQAALAQPGTVPAIARGFKIAERPYACAASDPDLANCPAGAARSGLAWAVRPADKANSIPTIVVKNGGLAGFSTLVALAPDDDIAVVVLVNSRSPKTTSSGGPTAPSAYVAFNVLYTLLAACQSSSGCPR